MTMRPQDLLTPTPKGLYCPPADVYIDPLVAVDRALITHAHADHARPGHAHVLATRETLDIMAIRMGAGHAKAVQTAKPGETIRLKGIAFTFYPAGHVLGSAQILVEADGLRMVVTGDYKRAHDPTCAAFEPIACHVLITEATFGLPVFRHPPAGGEITKLLKSLTTFPEQTHLLGVYSLGKAQRVISLIRQAGYDRPIHLHGALEQVSAYYQREGYDLGTLVPAKASGKASLPGEIVLCPPSALRDRWSARFADPVTLAASGWMRVRARARQSGVELPLIISDHADWDGLRQTVKDCGAEEVWVTHGAEEALVHWCEGESLAARPLRLVGYDDGGEAA